MNRNITEKRIIVWDTTLRDGEQAPSNSMSPEQKLSLAIKLEQAGVDIIETGFPASSSEDFRATQLISKKLTKSTFATFSRALIQDIKAAIDAGGVGKHHNIQLLATGSDLHLKHKRKISREQGINEIIEAVSYAKSQNIKHISVGIEDASRASIDYVKAIINASVTTGANKIVIADTTGFSTPHNFYNLIKNVKEYVSSDIKISTHCHNDLGMALANAIAGVKAGADEVQVTLGGLGERAGNTSLEQLAAFFYYKGQEYGVNTNIRLDKLYTAYNELRSYIDLEDPRTQPIFGKYAFGTAAGIHQQGIINNPDTYEYVKPYDFSREREFFISRHSGRAIFKPLLEEMKIKETSALIDELYKKFIQGNNRNCLTLNEVRKHLKLRFYNRKESKEDKLK